VDEKCYLRQNFDKSNNINYRDGDKQSSKYYNFVLRQTHGKEKNKKHIIPKAYVTTVLGRMVRKYDVSNERTTLINDKSIKEVLGEIELIG
jgi:hypothetical protein